MIVQQFAGIGRWLLSQCVKLHTLVWLVTAAAVWGEEGGGGAAIDRKERWGAGESFLSLSTVCDHWSAALLYNAISQ